MIPPEEEFDTLHCEDDEEDDFGSNLEVVDVVKMSIASLPNMIPKAPISPNKKIWAKSEPNPGNEIERAITEFDDSDISNRPRLKTFFEIFLWDKIARPHRKPFGLFYPLETCFSAESFHP